MEHLRNRTEISIKKLSAKPLTELLGVGIQGGFKI